MRRLGKLIAGSIETRGVHSYEKPAVGSRRALTSLIARVTNWTVRSQIARLLSEACLYADETLSTTPVFPISWCRALVRESTSLLEIAEIKSSSLLSRYP